MAIYALGDLSRRGAVAGAVFTPQLYASEHAPSVLDLDDIDDGPPPGVVSLDAWTRFDTGARYTTKIERRPTTFRATVQNVFDREYWSGVASYGAFSPGYPRTLQQSATVDF